MKEMLFVFVFTSTQLLFVSSDYFRTGYAGKYAKDDVFEMVLKPPTKDQQDKWCDELGISKEQRGVITYDLDKKFPKEKKFSTKWLGTDEIDVIGEGNCFYRVFSYWITGNENNYMKIREAVVEFIKKHNSDEFVKKYIADTGVDQDGCGYSDYAMLIVIAVRFDVNIYYLRSPPGDDPHWVHFSKDPLGTEKHNSIMLRYTGDHHRVIADVSDKDELTTLNRWNACSFKVIVFTPEKAHLPEEDKLKYLIINPAIADVKKVENLITVHRDTKKYRGKLIFFMKKGKGKEEEIRCCGKLSEAPYNFKCGDDHQLIARVKN